MRSSIRENDRGYTTDAWNHKVYVDGVEMDKCFTADEEEGIAYCYAVDEYGKLILAEDGESVKEVQVMGVVKIVG